MCCVSCLRLDRYHTDPSGSFTKFEAKAIGGGSEAAQTSLQEEYNKVSDFLLRVSQNECGKNLERGDNSSTASPSMVAPRSSNNSPRVQ